MGSLELWGSAEQGQLPGTAASFNILDQTTVSLQAAGGVLGIRDGTITGNGTVQGSLALGNDPAGGGGPTTPVLAPGGLSGAGVGTLTVTANFQTFAGTMQIDVAGKNPTEYDRVLVTGYARLHDAATTAPGGSVTGTLVGAPAIGPGDKIEFLHYGTLYEDFVGVTPPTRMRADKDATTYWFYRPNNPPTAANDAAWANTDTAVAVAVLGNDSDPDGDPLQIVGFTAGTKGTVALNDNGTPNDPTDDYLVYTPNPGAFGPDSFQYSISDGLGGLATATVWVTINTPPTAGDDDTMTGAGYPGYVFVLQNDEDPDWDTLTVVSYTQPAHGAVSIVDGEATYTPEEGFTGADSFTYTISDGHGGYATATVTITADPI